MKKLHVTLLLLLSFFISTGQTTKTIDLKKSKVEWLGKKVTGEHFGTIKLKSGNITISKENVITSGEFVVDMSTINCTDLSGKAKQSIESHLKDDDFFDVENYPTSTFKIKSSDKNKIYGIMKIKGISKPIEFDYKMESRGGQHIVFSEIKIDRTKFDIKYGSGSFFENLGDKMIYDDFIININPIILK